MNKNQQTPPPSGNNNNGSDAPEAPETIRKAVILRGDEARKLMAIDLIRTVEHVNGCMAVVREAFEQVQNGVPKLFRDDFAALLPTHDCRRESGEPCDHRCYIEILHGTVETYEDVQH